MGSAHRLLRIVRWTLDKRIVTVLLAVPSGMNRGGVRRIDALDIITASQGNSY